MGLNIWSEIYDEQKLDKDIELLKKSIYKWIGVTFKDNYEGGAKDCPLCHKYYNTLCMGCPIWDDTSWSGCAGTPYNEYLKNEIKERALKELQYLCQLYYILIRKRNISNGLRRNENV